MVNAPEAGSAEVLSSTSATRIVSVRNACRSAKYRASRSVCALTAQGPRATDRTCEYTKSWVVMGSERLAAYGFLVTVDGHRDEHEQQCQDPDQGGEHGMLQGPGARMG